jgi:hypothetical protein
MGKPVVRVTSHPSANCPVCGQGLNAITGDVPQPDDRLVCVIPGVVGSREHPTVIPPDKRSTGKRKSK